jgi:hypothetical protein
MKRIITKILLICLLVLVVLFVTQHLLLGINMKVPSAEAELYVNGKLSSDPAILFWYGEVVHYMLPVSDLLACVDGQFRYDDNNRTGEIVIGEEKYLLKETDLYSEGGEWISRTALRHDVKKTGWYLYNGDCEEFFRLLGFDSFQVSVDEQAKTIHVEISR